MGMPNQTPNLTANENILPFRIVYVPVNQGNFRVQATPASPDYSEDQVCPIGVTDGSISSSISGTAYNALAGEVVTLQRDSIVLLTAANAVPAGGYLEYTTGGLAYYNPPASWVNFEYKRFKFFQALQSANAGEVFAAMVLNSAMKLQAAT
jgi:hypothetical protein